MFFRILGSQIPCWLVSIRIYIKMHGKYVSKHASWSRLKTAQTRSKKQSAASGNVLYKLNRYQDKLSKSWLQISDAKVYT